jgi:predicted transcriptional regulator
MSRKRHDSSSALFTLGTLESEVLSIVCEGGGGSVGEVRSKLSRNFAYTTVMTTLDRLYKKNLLERHKAGRRFLYAPRIFRRAEEDLQTSQTSARNSHILTLSPFVSYLLDAVGTYDETLLQELEKKIAIRRQQFEQKETA